jgi:hypothetical protein
LPPSAIRDTNTARYQAQANGHTSPAVKFSRRMYVYAVAADGAGKVRITGEVVGGAAAPIVVTRRDSCKQQYKTVAAKVTISSSGTFTAIAPAPPSNAPGAVYLLRTRVHPAAGSKATFATNTLPRAVGY